MGAGRGARLKRKRVEAAAKEKAIRATPQGQREAAALAQANAEANARFKKQNPRGKRRGPISNTAIKGQQLAIQARAAQILGQRKLATISAPALTTRDRAFLFPVKKRDPRIIQRESQIAIQANLAKAKFLSAARDAEADGRRRAQENRSALAKGAALRNRAGKGKTSKKQLAAEQARQAGLAIQRGKEKADRLRAAGQKKFNEIMGLTPSKEGVIAAGQISAGISTKKSRQRSSASATAAAASRGGVASKAFSTGGSGPRLDVRGDVIAGQVQAQTSFAKQQAVRSAKATSFKAPSAVPKSAAPKAVGRDLSIELKETLGFQEKVKAKPKKLKVRVTRANGTEALVTQSTAIGLANRGLLAPSSVAQVLAPPTSQIGPQKPTKKPLSTFKSNAPVTIQNVISQQSSPFIQQAFAEEGGTFIDPQVRESLKQDPANIVKLQKNKVKIVGGVNTGDVVQEVLIPTLSGETFSAIAPTGENVKSIDGAIIDGSKSLNAGLGVEVGGPNFIGGETSVIFDPTAKVTTKEKSLISPTRDDGTGTLFEVSGGKVTQKQKKKSAEQIKAETIATRLGNAPFVTQVSLSSENLRQGSLLTDRSQFFRTDNKGNKIQIDPLSVEGQVINRIGEEQDVKNVLNAIQQQRFQSITNAKAEVDPITGQTIRTAGQVALDIARATPEPTVNFTFGAGSAFRPTGQEEEVEQLQDGSFILTKTGGFTDENLPFIQEVLETTPRASVQEGLGFGSPTIELETGNLNDDGTKEKALFLDPDRFSSQFRPQVGIVSVGKPDVIAQAAGSGRKFIISEDVANSLDKSGMLAAPLDNFTTGSKDELKQGGFEGIDDTFNLNQNLNATPNSPFALPINSGQVLESSPVTEDLAKTGAVDFPSFIQTASAEVGPAQGLIGPPPSRPSEQVSIQKPLFDEKTLGLGEVRDKFSFGDFLENPIEGLGQFAGGATRSAQNELAGIQNIGSLASGGKIPQREFLGTPSQQFYDAVITGALDVGGQNFGIAAQRFGELRQRGIGAVFEDPLGFIQSTQAVLNPIGSTLIGITQDPTVQQKFGELGQSILDNPFAAAGDISFQAATFLGPQAVLKVARVAGVIAPKAASAASLGVKLQKGQKIEAALIQSKKGSKKEVVNVLINKGQKLKKVENGLGGSHAIVVNKNTGDIIRVIETNATPISAKTAVLFDNSASVNRKLLKTRNPKEIAKLSSSRQKFGNLSSLSKSEQKILDAGKTQAGAIVTLDPTGTAQLIGKQGSIKVFEKGGKRVLLKEKTFELIDLKTGNKKITLRQDLAESVTQMPLGARLFDVLSGAESAVKPSSRTAQLPFRATESTEAGVLGKLEFIKAGESGKGGFELGGVFSPTGTRIGPLPKSSTDIAAALGRQKSKELNVFEDFVSKRGGFVTRETSLGESAGAASFDPFFGRTITPTADAAGVAGRQFLPETLGLGTGSTQTIVRVKPKLNTGSLTAKVFDTLSPAQKQGVIEESFTRGGIGTAKQSGKFADDIRTTALTGAAQGKSLRAILTDVEKAQGSGKAVATGKRIGELKAAREMADVFVTDKVGLPFTKVGSSTLAGKVGKGINQTLKARTKEFDVGIPTGTLRTDAQLTGEILREPAFTKALQKVPSRVIDDSLGISPKRLVAGFGETRLSVGAAAEGTGIFKVPKTFTQTAKSGVLKAVDDFALPKIQKAAALGDDFLNIQKGVIGATSKTVRSVTSVGKRAKGTPQKLLQKVRQPKPTGLLDDITPLGTIKIGKLGKGSKTIGKTADDLLEVGRTIKPKRGLPVGLITGLGSQVVQQFRPSTVTGIQSGLGFEQVLNPFQSSKQGVQSSVALVPRQAKTPAGRFQFPFAVPSAAQAQAQPFPQRQSQALLFGRPPPARNLFGPLAFGLGGGGQGDTGAGDLSARRKFFRVFDVAKTPFGRVERGLGIQVQSSAQIQEVSDVLGTAPKSNVSERFFGDQGNGGRKRRGNSAFNEDIFSF